MRWPWTVDVSELEPERGRNLLPDVVLAGGIAGALGAAAMVPFAAIVSWFFSGKPLLPLEFTAGILFGGTWTQGSGYALLGLAMHLAGGGGLGAAFALLLPRGGTASGTAAVCFGILYAMGTFVLLWLFVLPYLSSAMLQQISPRAAFPFYGIYGACLGLVPSLRRVLGAAAAAKRRVDAVEEKLG